MYVKEKKNAKKLHYFASSIFSTVGCGLVTFETEWPLNVLGCRDSEPPLHPLPIWDC